MPSRYSIIEENTGLLRPNFTILPSSSRYLNFIGVINYLFIDLTFGLHFETVRRDLLNESIILIQLESLTRVSDERGIFVKNN